MSPAFDPGALLGRSYVLARGPRVRLRMPRPHDAPAISALLRGQGRAAGELDLARLVRFDPRRRLVICAGALIDRHETMVGVGAIQLDGETIAPPELLVVDRELTEGLDVLLERALVGRAVALARSRAA